MMMKSFDIQSSKKQHVQVPFGLSFAPIELQRGFGRRLPTFANASRNQSLSRTNLWPSTKSTHRLGNRSGIPDRTILSNSHGFPTLVYDLRNVHPNNGNIQLVQRSTSTSNALLQRHEPPGRL